MVLVDFSDDSWFDGIFGMIYIKKTDDVLDFSDDSMWVLDLCLNDVLFGFVVTAILLLLPFLGLFKSVESG
ncbi:hypothetical protein HanIR_Chr12g0576431 [Helianthus annuus]|nr:hypothetical protein HanIR_Chr12g0576431 [Helianthus annuus]